MANGQRSSFAILAALLIVLASCQSTVQTAQPVTDVPAPSDANTTPSLPEATEAQDPCALVRCAAGLVCSSTTEGKTSCGCPTNTKSCNGGCITESTCCSNKDCKTGATCQDGTCVFSCQNVKCTTNKVCDDTFEGCTCPSDYRFCETQNKCIPNDHCCNAFECGRASENRCDATLSSARICIFGKGKACKFFDEDRSKPITVDDRVLDVVVENFNYTTNAQIRVGDFRINTTPNARTSVGNGMFIQMENIRENGGECNTRSVVTFIEGNETSDD